MAATPGNSLNIQTAGYLSFDGTATINGRTFQAGTGISLTNANGVSGNTTIATTGTVIGAWNDEATSFNALKNNGYFVTATATGTLPASPAQGDTIAFNVDTASILTIQANTGQVLSFGKVTSASAGTATSNFTGDSCVLVYRASDTSWRAIQIVGTFTVT